jgi:hypothetical protein
MSLGNNVIMKGGLERPDGMAIGEYAFRMIMRPIVPGPLCQGNESRLTR